MIRELDKIKAQDDEDRRENPNAIPCGWGCQIEMMIEQVVRDNHERWSKGQGAAVIEYLIKKKILVRYAGDVTFPRSEPLPTEDEIKAKALEIFKS